MFSESVPDLNNAIGLTIDGNAPNSDATVVTQIISALLPYLFTIAGLILFAMLIAGGFQMLTAANNPKAAEAGKTRITHAIIGFMIIFTAYWLTQILEIILGVKIL